MTHSHDCDCATCDPDLRPAMLALTRGDYATYIRLHDAYQQSFRTAAAHGELRVGIHYEEDPMNNSYAPPNPYEPHLATLRAASSTPAPTFEDTNKANRLRELNAEHARLAAHSEATPFPRVT